MVTHFSVDQTFLYATTIDTNIVILQQKCKNVLQSIYDANDVRSNMSERGRYKTIAVNALLISSID